jgi:general secretion pathway protein D
VVLGRKVRLSVGTRAVGLGLALALSAPVAVPAFAQENDEQPVEPALPAEDQDLPDEEPPPADVPPEPAVVEPPPETPAAPPAAPNPPSGPGSLPKPPGGPGGPGKAGLPPGGAGFKPPGGPGGPGSTGGNEPGSGVTTTPTATVTVQPKGSAAVPAGQELVNIDFPEPTEIKDIIKAVALWTGKNVILDRNVNGKVQIISPRKVTKEEAYQAFLSALNLLALTTVETGKVIKIMPVRTAVKGNLKTFLGSSWTPMTDEIITQIVPLKYIDAKEIQATLSRIVTSNAMIAYPPTNTLIVSDSGYKVRRVLDILELLDVQGQQAQVAIVPIRYAEAKSIADKVSEIFKNTSAATKGTSASSYRSYKIMTDERTNSVIIFGPPRTIADVKALVQKFDIPLDDPSRQSTIHVRPLDYADAKKLASTLSALATGSKNTRTPARRPPVGGAPGAAAAAEPLSVAELSDDVKIAPDESSNALLITGSHSAYQTINALIRKLDLRRSQVFVEADILDINMNSGFKFGTSIFAGRGGPNNTSIATTWQAAPLSPLIAAQATQGAAGATSATSQAQIEKVAGVFAQDMTVGILSGKEVEIAGLGKFRPGALIQMIKSDANTRILSSPHVLTANNEEASITVGEKIFFKTSDINPTTGTPIPKVEKEDVDLTLGIKPNISHANYVTLQINLESSSATLDSNTGLPKVNKRKTKQLVTVKNGQTVVVSGLVQTSEFQTFQKIPLLGDIPILGWLFRNSTVAHVRNNLMIFLTPHIIHGADDLAAVYKAKVEERDQFLASIYGTGHVNDDFYALLPTQQEGEYHPDEKDAQEKERREELLRQMYDPGGAVPAGLPSDSDKSVPKFDDSPITVPLSPSDGGGGGGGGDGGGGGMDSIPEPPEPPPEPEPAPEPVDG